MKVTAWTNEKYANPQFLENIKYSINYIIC